MQGSAIIVSAPSGSGKSTVVGHLLQRFPVLDFSVSACSRPRRKSERDGKEYFFLPPDVFRQKIAQDEFIEWEEVYPGSYYGTLKSELYRIRDMGKIPIFDVDVKGGLTLKSYFSEQALSIFIQAPSRKILEERLRSRGTDDESSLQQRLGKAAYESAFRSSFDICIINNELPETFREAEQAVAGFLSGRFPVNSSQNR